MAERLWQGLLLVAALLFAQAAAGSEAAPRIGVITMQPGEVFWERFGHDALLVDSPEGGAISYNFGAFDPAEPDFLPRFVRGQMRYYFDAVPLRQDLQPYRRSGRGVTVQWLNLTPDEARRVAALLAENAKPENAAYHYDYFRNNCATRVRDTLDTALDGALAQAWQNAPPTAPSYRSEATRLASPSGWMWFGFELGLGSRAEAALTPWESAFIPMRLADLLRHTRLPDGRPLVLAETRLLPHRLGEAPSHAPRPLAAFALTGLLLATALYALGRWLPRLVTALALGFWLLCSALGALLLYLWFGSAHWAMAANQNLLLLNPLALLLVPGTLARLRGRPGGRLFCLALPLVALMALATLPLAWLPLWPQDNALIIALLLPLHLAFALHGWPQHEACQGRSRRMAAQAH